MFYVIGTILLLLALAYMFFFETLADGVSIVEIVLISSSVACFLFNIYFSEIRHKVKVTRAKV